ncbi:MAG: acetate uptake transporter [Desulfuromonadales bacterium]|nr:acetate uptake transporter [Desulfuromonadales bacterium]
MQDMVICPYYDNDEDLCDVGCGYISSHDASMIIKFCSCQYQDCHKYRELADRSSCQRPVSSVNDSSAISPPASISQTGNHDNLPVFGLFCYSITVASYAADKLPVLPINLHLLAIMIMLGAVGQISAGLNSLKCNPLRAIAFTGFGLFWLSVLALDILPRAGYGSVPGSIPMMGYFAMWGMFSMVICQGLEQLTRICRVVFALMTAFLLMLALAQATENTALLHSSALIGLASSLPGLYLGLRFISGEAIHLFQPDMARPSKIRP